MENIKGFGQESDSHQELEKPFWPHDRECVTMKHEIQRDQLDE